MRYQELLNDIVDNTGIPVETIRDVLAAVPQALLKLDLDEQVRTPLGVFLMRKRRERAVKVPTSDEIYHVEEGLVVRLRSGSRLRREIE